MAQYTLDELRQVSEFLNKPPIWDPIPPWLEFRFKDEELMRQFTELQMEFKERELQIQVEKLQRMREVIK